MHPNSVKDPPDSPPTGDVTKRHVRKIAEIEQAARNQRSLAERLVDALAALIGNIYFFMIHAVGIAVWILLNSGVIAGIAPFDPYPWRTLMTVLALEGLLISFMVLMIQQRMTTQNQQRAHFELQISLLAEAESTKALEMLRALCAHHGLKEAEDPDVGLLSQTTEAGKVMKEVERNLADK